MQTQIPAGELANQATTTNNNDPTLSPNTGEKGGAPGHSILQVKRYFDFGSQNQAAFAQHDTEEWQAGGLAQDDTGKVTKAKSPKRSRKPKTEREKEQAQLEEKQKQDEAQTQPPGPEPEKDLILYTTSGRQLVLPSREKAVSVEQLVTLGAMQEEKIAADSVLWRGETARRAAIERLTYIRGKDKHVNPMRLNQAQREVDLRAGKRNIILKARQLGITTYVAARFFLSTILQPGTLSVQVTHDQDSAEQNFRIVHRFLENLPPEWRRSGLRTSRANVRQIIFPKLDSEYRVESAADRCAGRGLTIQNLHCSEVARWPHDVAETLAALRAAVPPDGEIFLESTPSGAGGTFYEEWHDAPETGYVQHFFPWWREESYTHNVEIVDFTDEELELMMKHGLNAGQIAFRREMRSQFRNRFAEEYAENPETCFLSSGNCMFDCEVQDDMLRRPLPQVESRQNGKLLYFLQPQPGRDYILGVDPSSGHPEGDYGCIQVIDKGTGAQCAEWHDRFRPEELAACAVELARDYNMALIAVERNGVGEATVSHLRVQTDYPYVYCSHGAAGWLTTDMSRERALSAFQELLENQPDLFVSKRLVQECRSFVRDRKGKCAAAPGAHDDMVMAMAIAQAVRGEARIKVPRSEKGVAVAALAA